MLRLFLLVFLAVIIDALRSQDGPKFRPDYTYVEEINGWLKLHRVPSNWFDARKQCKLEGAVLASPLNKRMLRAMSSITEKSPSAQCGVYTGIHAWFASGVYTSIEGTPLWKMPVDFGKSNACSGRELNPCAVLLPSGTIDTVDGKGLYPFMCYRTNNDIPKMSVCGTTDSEYYYYEAKHQCYKFHAKSQNWTDAFKICHAEGGYLTIINSEEEAKVISNIFTKFHSSAIEGNDKLNLLLGFRKLNGIWTTVHGQTLQETDYEKWSPGESSYSPHPDPVKPKELCGSMDRSGLFDVVWCHVKYPFICEKHLSDVNDDEEPPLIQTFARNK